MLVTYLKDALETRPGSRGRRSAATAAATCRSKRREIERGLRDGSVLGVVSTNALELGIDIGSLDAAVLARLSGQRRLDLAAGGPRGAAAGRVGGGAGGDSTPLNQFIAKNPDYFFDAPVEQARINPDNLQILVSHLKCAAFELPFTRGRDASAARTWREILALPRGGAARCTARATAGTGRARAIPPTR